MTVVTGLEWPDAGLGPLCPGEWVQEIDLEDLPGEEFGAGEEWFDDSQGQMEIHGGWGDTTGVYGNPPDLEGADAVDRCLSESLVEAQKIKCVQQATDMVARAFFQVRTQRDLSEAFALLSSVTERYRLAQGVIELAVQRVVQLERKSRQEELDQLRKLNRQMADWARSVSYRVRLTGEQNPVAQKPRDQAWVLVELRPGMGQVCRGKDVGSRPVVMAEPEIFSFMVSRTA